jgi:hypothetical protein
LREKMLPQYAKQFSKLALAHTPDALFVTCSDSRVVPDRRRRRKLERHGNDRMTAGDGISPSPERVNRRSSFSKPLLFCACARRPGQGVHFGVGPMLCARRIARVACQLWKH